MCLTISEGIIFTWGLILLKPSCGFQQHDDMWVASIQMYLLCTWVIIMKARVNHCGGVFWATTGLHSLYRSMTVFLCQSSEGWVLKRNGTSTHVSVFYHVSYQTGAMVLMSGGPCLSKITPPLTTNLSLMQHASVSHYRSVVCTFCAPFCSQLVIATRTFLHGH